MTTAESSAVTAAALARLHDYLRKAAPDESERIIVADAFMSGFTYGSRWAVRTMAALSNPEFRHALNVLCELLNAEAVE